MNKVYKEGEYYIRHFGFFGEKMEPSTAFSYKQAQEQATEHDAKKPGYSSVILRCLQNTKLYNKDNKDNKDNI